MDGYDVTASALTAQRLRMDAISSNLANVNTTRKADGSIGAYHRKNVSFAPLMQEANGQFAPTASSFLPAGFGGSSSSSGSLGMKASPSGMSMDASGHPMLIGSVSSRSQAVAGVQVTGITEDNSTPMRLVYDPSNPDANGKGYVEMPNVNVVTEMVDMISASRAYEANVTALQSVKGMAQAALEL
jgi:flagellar basal-body rod protein FlgC